jgi:hypothetical protein
MKKGYFLIGIQLLAFTAFIFVTLGMVYARGVCCGDDGYYAHIAKNLADGLGYATTLSPSQPHYSVTLFEPDVGSGPTIILPTAIIIKLVGNTYWAPGVTEVLLWSSLLLCIVFVLNKMIKDKIGLTIATVVFLFFSYTFMAYHFEQWYALLGEIPAVLLIILAILVYFLRNSKTNLFITGLLFSLAIQSKLVSFIPFGIFLFIVVLYQIIDSKKNIKAAIRSIFNILFVIALGFALPIFLFELWKLITLQPSGYYQWWKKYIAYMLDFGVNVDQNLGARIVERINIARQRFGIFLPVFLVIFTGIGFVIRKERKLFSLFVVFVSIIIAYTIYWMLFSIGWARYYVIPLIMIIFVLIIPFLDQNIKISHKAIFLVILAGLSIYNIKTIHIDYPLKIVKLYQPTIDTLALQDVSDMLSAQIEKRPFYTQWWAGAVDVEYIMDTHLNFSTIYDPAIEFSKPIIVIVNTLFMNGEIPSLTEFLSKCKVEKIVGYIYGECDPQLLP